MIAKPRTPPTEKHASGSVEGPSQNSVSSTSEPSHQKKEPFSHESDQPGSQERETGRLRISEPKAESKLGDLQREVQSLPDWTPRLETLVAEAKRNPHGHPPSLGRFSQRIAPLMEQALKSHSDFPLAHRLFSQLRDCALREDTSTAIRVVCAFNAERIVQSLATPDLQEEQAELRRALPPHVLRVLRGVQRRD
jgi:hypothetical protein